MLDINGGELLVLAAVGVIVLGPERLPQYAAQLGKLVRQARGFAKSARAQMREELGEDFDDIDWQSLDPRRYDPRRIVRDALLEDDDEPARRETTTSGTGSAPSSTADAGTGTSGRTASVDLTKSEGTMSGGPTGGTTSAFDPDAT